MKTKNPLDSVGWLGGSSNRLVINKAARKKATMNKYRIAYLAARRLVYAARLALAVAKQESS